MNADVFIDTNVLLYTVDEDPASASKRQRAEQLLLSERWGWSVQVAAEFFVNATSAKRPFKLSAVDATALVEVWFDFPTADLTPALFRAAVDLHQRFQLSYWDAAILAAAKQMGLAALIEESDKHGEKDRQESKSAWPDRSRTNAPDGCTGQDPEPGWAAASRSK